MMRSRTLVVLGLVLLAVASCAPRSDEAVRIAASPHGEGGIGGTGLVPEPPLAPAGIGVFGTVTGFGSVDVNGLRIKLPDDVATAVDGRSDPLHVGSTVAVAATLDGASVVAQRVAQFVPLRGPVDSLDAAGHRLTVMGTPVQVDADVALAGLAAGDWVSVSGVWRSSTVIASRLERVSAQGSATITGQLRLEGSGPVIGGTALDLTCCEGPRPGLAIASGDYRGGRLVANSLVFGADVLFPPSVKRLVIEAFLARNSDDPGFHLSGFGIPMDPASVVPPTVGQRSIFVGRYDGGFLTERAYRLPDSQAARQMELDRIGEETLLE